MDIMDLKELIEVLDKSSVSFLEFKTDEYYVKLDKSLCREKEDNFKNDILSSETESSIKPINQNAGSNNEKQENIEVSQSKSETVNEEGTFIIKSPMVGSFYKAPSPEDEPYAVLGSKVKKGDVVCIIEAMKLMNEIECEEDGEVIEILCKDGDLVEYGQPLFKIRKVK